MFFAQVAQPGMADVPAAWYLTLAAILFSLGAVGVFIRRNPVVAFMCIELMLNAVNLTLLTFARHQPIAGQLMTDASETANAGQAMVIFVMAVAAAEVAVGLGIIMAIFRLRNRVDLDDMKEMNS